MQEEDLARAWAGTAGGRVFTQEGEQITILFPGRANGGPGPDFRGALLLAEGGRVWGDVEVHLAASGWRGHGHGSNPAYNRVVLHVVGRDDVGAPTGLASGARVPVVVLGDAGPDDNGCCVPGSGLAHRLEVQGGVRFRARSARWRRAREQDEALYRALLGGLGYGSGRGAYRRLARVLPWAMLRGARGPREAQGLLLGTAGLIGPASGEVRALWRGRARMRASSWAATAGRPAASPARRLLGAGALFARWAPAGPIASLTQALDPLPEPARAPPVLRRWLSVEAGEAGLAGGPAPLGAGRADALAVNVLLPFLASRPETAGWAEAAYRAYPALERDTVVRAMSERLGLGGLRLSACQQQGLHRVFHSYCSRGRQPSCPLGTNLALGSAPPPVGA